jgi:hypothetical protein
MPKFPKLVTNFARNIRCIQSWTANSLFKSKGTQTRHRTTSIPSNRTRQLLRFVCAPRPLLAFAIGIILCQFIGQMEVAVNGWYCRWPYPWDQNRYISYALYFRAAFGTSGIGGLVDAYFARPPYSLTLLLGSIPLLSWSEEYVNVLHGQMIFYLILMDWAAYRLGTRLGGTRYAGIAALMVIHGSTTGIFNSESLLIPAETVLYQLNFGMAVIPVAGLALLMAGLTTKRLRIWAVCFAIFLAGAIMWRPPALPYIAVLFVPPWLAITAWLWWQGERRRAIYVCLAFVVGTCIAVPHMLYIAKPVIAYFQLAHILNPNDSKAYFWDQSSRTSGLFPYAFSILSLRAICDLNRLIGMLKRGKTTLKHRRALTQICLVWGVGAWIYVACFVIPTLSSNKGARFGDAFVILSLIFGITGLFRILKLLSLSHSRYAWDYLSVRTKVTVAICLVFSLIILADVRGTHATLRSWQSYKIDKEVDSQMVLQLEAACNQWANARNLTDVPIHAYGSLMERGFYQQNLRAIPGKNRLEQIKINIGPTLPHAVIAVLPRMDQNMKQYRIVRTNPEKVTREALLEVKANGFVHHKTIEIIPGIVLEVYVRPDAQLKKSYFKPMPYFP